MRHDPGVINFSFLLFVSSIWRLPFIGVRIFIGALCLVSSWLPSYLVWYLSWNGRFSTQESIRLSAFVSEMRVYLLFTYEARCILRATPLGYSEVNYFVKTRVPHHDAPSYLLYFTNCKLRLVVAGDVFISNEFVPALSLDPFSLARRFGDRGISPTWLQEVPDRAQNRSFHD
jgi:hypothetical protein